MFEHEANARVLIKPDKGKLLREKSLRYHKFNAKTSNRIEFFANTVGKWVSLLLNLQDAYNTEVETIFVSFVVLKMPENF